MIVTCEIQMKQGKRFHIHKSKMRVILCFRLTLIISRLIDWLTPKFDADP